VHKSSFGVAQLQLDHLDYEEGSDVRKVLLVHHKLADGWLLTELSGRLLKSLRYPRPPVGIPSTLDM